MRALPFGAAEAPVQPAFLRLVRDEKGLEVEHSVGVVDVSGADECQLWLREAHNVTGLREASRLRLPWRTRCTRRTVTLKSLAKFGQIYILESYQLRNLLLWKNHAQTKLRSARQNSLQRDVPKHAALPTAHRPGSGFRRKA